MDDKGRPIEEIAAEARATLQRIQVRSASLSPAARARLNQKLRAITEAIKRGQAERAVNKFLGAEGNHNGVGHDQDDQTIPAPYAPHVQSERAAAHGGQRKPWGWQNGTPLYEEEA